MLNALQTELLKLKRSKLFLIPLTAGLVPVIMVFFGYLIRDVDKQPYIYWYQILYNSEDMLNFLGPSLFALITGLIFAREYYDGMANIIFTCTTHRGKILFCKLLISILFILSSILISIIASVCIGTLIAKDGLSSKAILSFLNISLISFISQCALLPLAAAVGMLGKSDVAPSAFGAGILIGSLFISNYRINVFFPWSDPAVIFLKLIHKSGFSFVNSGGSFIIACLMLTLMFVYFLLFDFVYYIRSDIQ
jgi:bacitracin transport system permease protein